MIRERNLLSYVVLSIITCGFYSIYFWYKYSEDVNKICDGDGQFTQNYIVAIILSIATCGIYSFFWFYSVGNRIQANGSRYGINFQENGTTVLMWMLFGSLLCGFGTFFAMYILIKNMNILGHSYNGKFTGISQHYGEQNGSMQ